MQHVARLLCRRVIGAQLAMFVLVAFVQLGSSAALADDNLLGAASSTHLWLILEPHGDRTAYQLVHHPASESEWHYRQQHSMSQPPAAMAAWGEELWLVMPPRSGADGLQREVYGTHVQRNETTGLYYTAPVGHLEMLPSLNGAGRLAGFVATRDGPAALIVPMPRSATSITTADSSASGSTLEAPVLLRLEPGGSHWSEIPLPRAFTGSRNAVLGVAGNDLVLLDQIVENPARSVAYVSRKGMLDGDWDAAAFALDVRDVRELTTVAGQCVAVLTDRNEPRARLAYVRTNGLLPLTSLDAVDGKWMTCGFNDDIVVVARERGGGDPKLEVTCIDPLTGAIDERSPLTAQPLTAGRIWQITLALGLSLSAVLAVVLLRPPPATVITVDPSRVLPPVRRLAGLLIDLALGAVPAMLLLDCNPADLLAIPMLTIDFGRSLPYLLMVVFGSGLATIMEMLFGRSVGKILVSAHLSGLGGERVACWRAGLRGLVRLVVLVVPPLAVFVLTNSHMQGLPDMAARTLVLADRPSPTDESQSSE